MNWKVVMDLGDYGIVSFDTPTDPTETIARGVQEADAKNQHFVAFKSPNSSVVVPLARIQKIIISKEEGRNAKNSHDHK